MGSDGHWRDEEAAGSGNEGHPRGWGDRGCGTGVMGTRGGRGLQVGNEGRCGGGGNALPPHPKVSLGAIYSLASVM